MRTRIPLGTLLVAAALMHVTPARADGAMDARESYERGKHHYDGGHYLAAALAFAEADRLSPRAAVLELALVAVMKADEPLLGMDLVDRAEGRGMAKAAAPCRQAFATRVGAVQLLCPEAMECQATMDGTALRIGVPSRALVGEHAVVLQASGTEERLAIRVRPGETSDLRPTRVLALTDRATPPPAVPYLAPVPSKPAVAESPAKDNRLPWTVIGISATALMGGATIASGVDTLGRHGAFQRDPANESLAQSGRAAETRTNVLLVGTGVVAVATLAVAYLTWRSPAK